MNPLALEWVEKTEGFAVQFRYPGQSVDKLEATHLRGGEAPAEGGAQILMGLYIFKTVFRSRKFSQG